MLIFSLLFIVLPSHQPPAYYKNKKLLIFPIVMYYKIKSLGLCLHMP